MKKSTLIILFLFLITGFTHGSEFAFFAPGDTSRIQADSIMKAIHLKAFSERDRGRYENAEKLYREVVRLKETYAPDDTFRLANVYGNYANILISMWKTEEALPYLDKAIEMGNQNDKWNQLIWMQVKGNSLLNLNDVSSAIAYFDQIEKFIIKNNPRNLSLLKDIYLSKSSAYYLLQNSSLALKYLNSYESLSGLTQKEINGVNLKKFSVLYTGGENNNAIDLYNQISSKKLPSNTRNLLGILYATFLYNNLNRIDEAISLYTYLGKAYKDSSITKGMSLQIFNNLGNCYDLKNMSKEALSNYQKALLLLYPCFKNSDFRANPPSGSYYMEAQNLILFKNRAEVLYKYSKSSNDSSYMSASLQNCVRSVNIVQNMRYRITSEQSQYLISKKERYVFNLAQYVALEKFAQTKDEKYLNMAFEINEKGKAFTLLSAIRNQKAMDFSGIPAKLKKQESDLNRQLSLYDELIYKEKQIAGGDPVKISNWEDQLFNANEQYSKLLRKMEKEYPEYYRLKYDQKVSDIYEIQKIIDKRTVLVEYSLMDSVLIIYTVSKNKKGATKVILQPGFEEKCSKFLNLIISQNFGDKAYSEYGNYISQAYDLYSILILPIKDQLDGENLIVIPDGAISFLPFDALLTAKVPTGKPDYRHIPYLLRNYSIGYSYSSTLHFNPVKHLRIPSDAVLAFAPLYAKSAPIDKNSIILRHQDFLDLHTLPGAKNEVKNISGIFKTEAYYDLKAKESVFKEQAGRYKILHLAMHTVVNNDDPMLSKLVFTQIPDGEEDGFLNTYEVYNMKLNASLAVLSSCSSGYGKMQPGEGVQSLARGFAFAGCPSVLMTLWEVADFSTLRVMTNFYKYMKEHHTKPQALRVSKLNYIANADELQSNPFFWASFVVIGDSSPLYPFRSDMFILCSIMLIMPIGFLGVFYKKYRREEKNTHSKAA